jgi:hypothetical protein
MGWPPLIFPQRQTLKLSVSYFMNGDTETYLEFTDTGDLVRLEPIELSFPDADLDWDRSWVKTKVTVKAGIFSGQFEAEFQLTDFERLKQQLKELDNDFKANAIFDSLEQQLVLKIKGDGLGHFELYCKATPDPSVRQILTFSLSFDQTYLKEYIRQLEEIAKAFPFSSDFDT